MILVPFNSAHAFVALGSRAVVRIPNTFVVDGLLQFGPLTAVGVEKKRKILQMALFYSGHHVTQGAAGIRRNRITISLTNFHVFPPEEKTMRMAVYSNCSK